MHDILVKNARIWNKQEISDIAVSGEIIEKIEPFIDERLAKQVIDVKGDLVSPGFVDSHLHFDMVLSLGKTESPTLQEVVADFTKYLQAVPPKELKDDIKCHERSVVRICYLGGTTALRTNSNEEASVGLIATC